jgi:hypothetical protein
MVTSNDIRHPNWTPAFAGVTATEWGAVTCIK